MAITDEQRRRMEANRAAALSRLKQPSFSHNQTLPTSFPDFNPSIELILELSSPHYFAITLAFGYGFAQFHQLPSLFSFLSSKVSPSHWIQFKASECVLQVPVYKLVAYASVVNVLKAIRGVQIQHVPQSTRKALANVPQLKRDNEWIPFHPRHVPNSAVEELLCNLPPRLKQSLLPFQWEGVRYSLRRGGRALLADEMGVGKTIQAIAVAACYMKEGSLLVVCPASLRLVWAEELERWLTFLSPRDIHVVFGRRNELAGSETPKVMVISYTMLNRLREDILSRSWEIVIVDESHTLRCSRRPQECEETMSVLAVAEKSKRAILLSGTPSLSRPFDIFNQINCLWPGLLGRHKYEFARGYCCSHEHPNQYMKQKDYSKGTRLQELNVLLKETVMVRRLKRDVLSELPPKRRQVLRLELTATDILRAKAVCDSGIPSGAPDDSIELCKCGFTEKGTCDCEDSSEDEVGKEDKHAGQERCLPSNLDIQEIGCAKIRSIEEWLINNPVLAEGNNDDGGAETSGSVQKMVIFGHHHRVLNSLQEIVCSRKVQYVRIDGHTDAKDRQKAIELFQHKIEVRVAIVGITAGGVGLNLCAAQTVVFAELPKSASELVQAEDRAHRRGQQNSVNIYIFCAKDTSDEMHWQSLSKSLERISTMTNGLKNALLGIEVHSLVDHTSNRHLQTLNCIQADTPVTAEAAKEGVSTFDLERDIASKVCADQSGGAHTLCEQEENYTPNETARLASDLSNEQPIESKWVPVECLMFEMSLNTGRVHLYSKEGRMEVMLEANFRPEDLEYLQEGGLLEPGTLPEFLVKSLSHREAVLSFVREWQKLRPVYRKRLAGRPVRLPLSRELACTKDVFGCEPGGLVRGGSKRRIRPQEESTFPLPQGASFHEVSWNQGKKRRRCLQAWTLDGTPLCKLCHSPCLALRSKSPQSWKDLFCCSGCFEEHKLKTSQHFLRLELFELERGVCTNCNLDCHALVECIQKLPLLQRSTYIAEKAPLFMKQMIERLALDPIEGNAWHADHIVPVADGGGECNLENMRTLCVACHVKVTSEQQRRRRSLTLKARNALNIAVEKLMERHKQGNAESPKWTSSDNEDVDANEIEDDKELLGIEVNGSAYSKTATTYSNPCAVFNWLTP